MPCSCPALSSPSPSHPHHFLLLGRLVRAAGIIFRAVGLRARPFGRFIGWLLPALLGAGLTEWTSVRHGVGLLDDR